MNYIVAKCPKCGRWQITSTKKDKYEATFRCKFCRASKKLYLWKKWHGPTPTDLEWAYFGPDYSLARAHLLHVKGGRHVR